jgi:hypothetical protein
MTYSHGYGELLLFFLNFAFLSVFLIFVNLSATDYTKILSKGKRNKIKSLTSTIVFSGLILIYILLLRAIDTRANLNIFKKFISLFQNWWPANEMWLDSNIISNSIVCGKKVNLYEPNECFGFLWNYPALFKYLPIEIGSHKWIIQSISLLGAFAAILLFVHFTKFNLLITLSFVFSPGFAFAIERANLEFLVVLLSMLSGLICLHLIHKKKLLSKIIFLSFLFIAILVNVSLKFYPIGLTVIFIYLLKEKILRYILLFFLIIYLVISIQFLDLLKFYPNAPSPQKYSYGLITILNALGNYQYTGLLFLLIIFGIFRVRIFENFNFIMRLVNQNGIKNHSSEILVLAPIILFCGVFILGGNTVYRSILLAPVLFLDPSKIENRLILLTSLIICWTSPLEIVSNIFILILILLVYKSKAKLNFNDLLNNLKLWALSGSNRRPTD